jgi:hypothetical protein
MVDLEDSNFRYVYFLALLSHYDFLVCLFLHKKVTLCFFMLLTMGDKLLAFFCWLHLLTYKFSLCFLISILMDAFWGIYL